MNSFSFRQFVVATVFVLGAASADLPWSDWVVIPISIVIFLVGFTLFDRWFELKR